LAALAVLGAGAWGTAIAAALSSRHRVTLWARDAAQARAMGDSRRNLRYLAEIELPENLRVTHEAHAALSGADLALLATPVAGLRESLARVADIPFVWLCKGFEQQSAALPHEIVAASGIRAPGGALSGPSFARVDARG
jgi:glycerol-3-phosphate dehydrogenase (NAD(P)+)